MISAPSDSTPRPSRPVLRAIARSVSLRDGNREPSLPHSRNDGASVTERKRKTLSSSSMTDLLFTSPKGHADLSGECCWPENKEDRNGMFKRKLSLVKKPGFNSAESAVPIKSGNQDSFIRRISSLVRRNSTRPSPEPSPSQTLSSDPAVSSDTPIQVSRDWDPRGDDLHDSERLNDYPQASTELEVVLEEPSPPLPTPCQGLFESSGSYSSRRPRPSSSKLMVVVDHASANDLLLPASLGEDDLPVPLPFSPLLSPIIGQANQINLFNCEALSPWNIALPPSPIVTPSPSMSGRDVQQHSYLDVELNSALRGHSHSRRLSRSGSASESDESSSAVVTPSVDVLSPLSLEYALNVSGCKLKDSARPKTWASDQGHELGVYSPLEGIKTGVGGLVVPTEKHIMPSTAIIVDLRHRQLGVDEDESPNEVKGVCHTSESSTSEDGVEVSSADLDDVPRGRKSIAEPYPVGAQLPSKERNARKKSATFFDRFRRAFVGSHEYH